MTEKRARALHRAMWRWLAKHPGAYKADWPGWRLREKNVDVETAWDGFRCFACLIVDENCERCVIRNKGGHCFCSDSLFDKVVCMRYRDFSSAEWADVCNRMADAWREIPEN